VSVGCSTTAEAPPPLPIPAPSATLGPGDVFEVRVFGEPDLTGVYRVGGDGMINFPLVGRISVGGLPANEAGDVIALHLQKYVRSPSISLFVREYSSRKVYVFGEVKKPGTFPYEDGMNIIEAITVAGGFEKLANKNGISVTRIVDGREQRMKVPVLEISEGKAPNFRLEPGDIVWVPESIF
jgi:protein involved in polysaccharide export with SLBB domain